ncbi:phosphoenolpyruvate carboxykinase (ATP) [Vagococcus elongatus]|uniref:phosphoenolpyruvate carboxykinase (ATP) n=1 Tax=Vagococcus elongatus TaxID=180344 RepID=A0A430AMD7_9ENTE|nr:phosphoenolpyruvate carboxykinase (ATP) [Vagococcus elongatus]RSU09067.1 phosphoenolpyruvate carboxykinase [Vagococcus elongatus]
MSSISQFRVEDINQQNPIFSDFRVMVETAFYGNHVKKVSTLEEAYVLAKDAPGTIVTDLPVYQPEELGLPSDAKILVDNCGGIVGRTSAARRFINQQTETSTNYGVILREALFQAEKKAFYRSRVVVGLDEDFMINGHVMVPEGYEQMLYSYLLNFQVVNEEYQNKYQQSKPYAEGDIFLFADPDWSHPDFPLGLALFDPDHNVAAILGLRYFGEFKKATLTLAWTIAHRNNFVSCHGGMKQFELEDKSHYTMAAFGLSGSGKSTITLANHQHKYPIKVLHDDAFVISKKDGSSIALEPAYFDKTQDYPMASQDIQYFLTAQNVGVTMDNNNRKVLVTEDIRNGNGRTVKSRFATPNRVNHLSEKIDAIFWIMKDDSLPPLVKLEGDVLPAVFGATLATKRSTAENLDPNVKIDNLVIEPFANPFRAYPLGEDYLSFKTLFSTHDIDCYILNTGFYNDKKVTAKITLSLIEKIIENQASFEPMGPLAGLSYLPVAGYEPDFNDKKYMELLKVRMETRLNFIREKETINHGFDSLPTEASLAMTRLIKTLEKYLR